jgi:hypothetical protein
MPLFFGRGQSPGTATSDSASAGNVGELISGKASNSSATVTITIASPGVVSWTTHGLALGSPVVFTTTNTLPTGIVSGTVYWVIPVDANSFQIATSVANAIAGTAINTSGSQAGVHTGTGSLSVTNNTALNLAFISLTAGDWDVWGTVIYVPAGTTTVQELNSSISTTTATLDQTDGDTFTDQKFTSAGLALSGTFAQKAGPKRISIAATTTVYLVGYSNFGTSTMTAWGKIRARRAR